jgi:hypothetical protein
MYGVWLSKQSSGFCATGSQMARVHASRENRCSNCGLSRELHTSMSALASKLGCSLRGWTSWRIVCIKMVAPIGSLLTGSSSTFCFMAHVLWHLLALCPTQCIGLRSAKTLLDGGNSWEAKSLRKLLRFRTHIVPYHLG